MKLRVINNFLVALLFISFLAFSNLANAIEAELKFTKWDEKNIFTDFGRTVEVSAELSVKLPENSYIDNWTYVFSEGDDIRVLQTSINDKPGNFSFINNNLQFKFGKIKNNETIKVVFIYERHNANSNLYFRQEAVVIPKWLKDAKSKIEVIMPSSHVLCTIHPEFKSSSANTKFTWSGTIGGNGFNDVFIFTPTSGKWEVAIRNTIEGLKNYRKLELMYPVYFQNNGQKVQYYNVSNSLQPVLQKERDGYHILEYSYVRGSIETNIKAIVNNGADNYYSFNLSPKKFLSYAEEDRLTLDEILKIIRRRPNPYKLPEYVRIAQWVHDYIKYDKTFVGKKMSDSEIYRQKKGVREHYSQLYRDLCRYAGISAVMISGVSYDQEDQDPDKDFIGHAWVMVHHDGKWLNIDPTWGLYSGIIPTSHIFLYYEGTNSVSYKIEDNREISNDGIITKQEEFVKDLNM